LGLDEIKAANHFESAEINVFSLLMRHAFDGLLGLTGESINNIHLPPLSQNFIFHQNFVTQ
jgi:hypothetical protein